MYDILYTDMLLNKLESLTFTQGILLEKGLKAEKTEKVPPVPPEQNSDEVERMEKFGEEVIELLKLTQNCCIALDEFESSYYDHFQKKCDASDYGFTELTELFRTIPSVAEVKVFGKEKVICLATDEYLKEVAERVISVIKTQPKGMIEMSKLCKEFENIHGYKLTPQKYRCKNLQCLLQQLKYYFKIVKRVGVYFVCYTSSFSQDDTLREVSLNIRSMLMEHSDGSMKLPDVCCAYEKRFGPNEDLISYLKQMDDVVMIDNGYLKLTPLQLFARNIILLLQENSGRLKISALLDVYKRRFGVSYHASDYHFKTTNSLLRHFGDYFKIDGSGKTGGRYVSLKYHVNVCSSDAKCDMPSSSVSPVTSLNSKQNVGVDSSDPRCDLKSCSVSSVASLSGKQNLSVYSFDAKWDLPFNPVSSVASLNDRQNVSIYSSNVRCDLSNAGSSGDLLSDKQYVSGSRDISSAQVPGGISLPVLNAQAPSPSTPSNIDTLNVQIPSHLPPPVLNAHSAIRRPVSDDRDIWNSQVPSHLPPPVLNAQATSHQLTPGNIDVLNAQLASHLAPPVLNARLATHLPPPVLNVLVPSPQPTPVINARDPSRQLTRVLNELVPSHRSTQVLNARVPSYLSTFLNAQVPRCLSTAAVSVQAPGYLSIPVFNTHVSGCLPMETWMTQGFGDLLGFETLQTKDDPRVGQPYFQSFPPRKGITATGPNKIRTATIRNAVSTTETSQTCFSAATITHSVSCPEISTDLSVDHIQNLTRKCQGVEFLENTEQPDSFIINAPEMGTSGEKLEITSANQNTLNSPVNQEDNEQENSICSLIIGQNSVSIMPGDLTEGNNESVDAKKEIPRSSTTSTSEGRQQRRRNRIAAKFSVPLI